VGLAHGISDMHTAPMIRNEYSSERPYWDAYVSGCGGAKAVSDKLGIPYPTIAGICNGNRGIGRKLACRMAAADPLLDVNRLIWVTPEKQEAA